MTDWFELNIDAMLNAYVASTQKTFAHDRSKTVGSSEVFSCMRQLFFKKRGKELGYKPDEGHVERWGATRRGDIIENHHLAPALQTQCPNGATLEFAGSDQVTLVEARTSATPDGLFTGLPRQPLRIIAGGRTIEVPDFALSGGSLAIEFKSIDPRAHLAEERAKHRGQVQTALGLIHEKTEFRPNYALILYCDASFIDHITPFLVPYDARVYAAAKSRAGKPWEYDSPLDFVAEGKFTGECDHCIWRQACGEAILSEWATTDAKAKTAPEVIEALTDPAETYIAAQAEYKAAEQTLEIAKQALKDALLEQGARKAKSDDWSIAWTTQKGRTTVDYKTAFADHGIDPEPYTKQSPGFDVLRVTRKDPNEGVENEH